MLVIKSNVASPNTALPILNRDQLLDNALDGVRWDFDLAFPYSYAGGAPANGSVVRNAVDGSTDGAVVLQAGESLSFAGGGFDFSAITKRDNYLRGPSAPLADIWSSVNQYFLVCEYVKLPALADWNTSASLFPLFQTLSGTDTYQTAADLVLIAMQKTSLLSFRRQKAAASVDTLTLTPNSLDYGSVVQLAFWRNGSGQFARLRSANGTVISSGAVSTNNTQNFSANNLNFGPAGGFVRNVGAGGTIDDGQQNSVRHRLYRGFIENLLTSGRNPVDVLDSDYARVVERNVFS